jgi:preprotein translocase subunit YajC
METLAYAAPASGGSGASSPMGSMLIPLILMFVIFYFLLIRPQQKKQRQHQEMLKSLKKGDKVITSGGLYGVVVKVTDKDVVLEVADKVNLRFTLGAIGTVREREGAGKKESEH